ncbi:MAG: sugar phosphate isomerase/epimerase [Thermomicrobiales bacterium]
MPRAVSTWSLHRTLGNFIAPDSSVTGGRSKDLPATAGISLLELPAQLAAHGYDTLHLCHFHLASREAAYLASVRAALDEHGIALDTFLIDDGDLTAADADRHEAWYGEWLDVAAALGAQRARIGAGRSAPTPALLAASGERLARLAASHPEVRVVTENWLEMTPNADAVLAVLDAAGEGVGLLIDLGNWSGASKYDDLAKLAPRAETCHAKCHFTAAGPDADDFRRSLAVLQDAGFDGPLALIYDGPDADEWAGLDREWEIVTDVFASETVSA